MSKYPTAKEAKAALLKYRKDLRDEAKSGIITTAEPEWKEVVGLIDAGLPASAAGKAKRQMSRVKKYRRIGEPGAAAFHVGLLIGYLNAI